jgi:predicted nucleic-acid-binding protein
MRSLDTNILARFYVRHAQEDEQTVRQREAAIQLLEQEPALFVPRTVILELEWLLRGHYQQSREAIFAVMEHLLGLPNVQVEDVTLIESALSHYCRGLDFADALHLTASRHATALCTFDERVAKRARRLELHPPCENPLIA